MLITGPGRHDYILLMFQINCSGFESLDVGKWAARRRSALCFSWYKVGLKFCSDKDPSFPFTCDHEAQICPPFMSPRRSTISSERGFMASSVKKQKKPGKLSQSNVNVFILKDHCWNQTMLLWVELSQLGISGDDCQKVIAIDKYIVFFFLFYILLS